ncbi:MAG: hypothetical protein PHY43_12050 [Verrucomicrobiales bacterium]|nr:hypothetical protein [Verrucomicrobiales bacterium]
MRRSSPMARKFVSFVGLTTLVLLPIASNASGILYQFDTPFPSDPSPSGSTPWITANFDDASGGVLLTIAAVGLTGSEFASQIYFNLAPSLDPASLTFNATASSGTFSVPTIDHASQNSYKADGDGKYDFRFNFGTANGTTFGAGDSITYLISGISGLTASNFSFLSAPAGGSGPFYGAAHIQALADGSSTWIEPGIGPIITPVPEPAPIALLAVSTILWGIFRLRMRKD